MFSFPWTVTWIKSIFCLFVCFSYKYAYWVVSKGDKISELSEATRLEQTKTTKRPLSWIDISFPSMDETESLWSADPRSRRALDSMLLSLPDLRPMSQSSLAARSSPQNPQTLTASSLCSCILFCWHCPSFYPLPPHLLGKHLLAFQNSV